VSPRRTARRPRGRARSWPAAPVTRIGPLLAMPLPSLSPNLEFARPTHHPRTLRYLQPIPGGGDGGTAPGKPGPAPRRTDRGRELSGNELWANRLISAGDSATCVLIPAHPPPWHCNGTRPRVAHATKLGGAQRHLDRSISNFRPRARVVASPDIGHFNCAILKRAKNANTTPAVKPLNRGDANALPVAADRLGAHHRGSIRQHHAECKCHNESECADCRSTEHGSLLWAGCRSIHHALYAPGDATRDHSRTAQFRPETPAG